jgi:hypothetical protein
MYMSRKEQNLLEVTLSVPSSVRHDVLVMMQMFKSECLRWKAEPLSCQRGDPISRPSVMSLGFSLSVLSLVWSNVIWRHSTQTIFSLRLRKRWRSATLLGQECLHWKTNPSSHWRENLLPSSSMGWGMTHRQHGDSRSLLPRCRLKRRKYN